MSRLNAFSAGSDDAAKAVATAYQEVLNLTVAQSAAIRDDRWEDLIALLDRREHVLARAALLLGSQKISHARPNLRAQLRHVKEVDEANSKLFGDKKAELAAQIVELDTFQGAVARYATSALTFDAEPTYVDWTS